jgi:nitrile hydratase subunit beta
MNGVHDMGGMDGFGKVEPEANEPVFHADWEARVMAMNRAMGATGAWNIDMSRYSREILAPEVYLSSSYYRKWLLGLEQMLLERDLVGADEIAEGRALRPGKPLKRKFTAAEIDRVLTRGSFSRVATAPARFKPGDRVRARNINPRTHTRLPRYVRGHLGIVERLQGCHVFPDAAATGEGEQPQWLYTVCFGARELWGDNADPTVTVSVEAFEPYLEPV